MNPKQQAIQAKDPNATGLELELVDMGPGYKPESGFTNLGCFCGAGCLCGIGCFSAGGEGEPPIG